MLRLSLGLVLLASCSASVHEKVWVQSPGYPHGYQPFSKQEWKQCAPKAHQLRLSLTHLDLEDSLDCENDALEIYTEGQLIVSLCGKKSFEELRYSVNPLILSSPSGCLSLTFRSDYSNPERHTGFRGVYTVQDVDECENPSDKECSHFCHNFIGGYYCSCRHGYILDQDQHTCTVRCNKDLSGSTGGRITSPSRPYPDNSRCRYTLSVESHLQIELVFSTAFDVEQGPDGECRDFLTVDTGSGMLGPFCGTVAPSPILTHSNQLVIHFNSDNYGSNNGFTLSYRARGKTCSGEVTPNSLVAPYREEHHSGDSVIVTCETGHHAETPTDFRSQYVTTCQKTGIWSPLYSCELLTCDLDINPEDVLQLVANDYLGTEYGDQIQFECTSEYYTLEGPDTYECGKNGTWVSLDGRNTFPRCVEVCGKTSEDVSGTGRILGGEVARVGQIPWQLSVRGRVLAGASLIGDRWVLTAAHVVDSNADVQLYGGVSDLAKTNPKPDTADHRLQHDKIIIHPQFGRNVLNRDRYNYDNDIALIRLASRATLGPNLRPICLPATQGELTVGLLGSVSGWGMTEDKRVSQALRYAPISVYSSDVCQITPTFGTRSMLFTSNMFCAGAEGKDSCSRDSGGPYFVPKLGEGNKGGRGPYRIEGIVSWGADCKDRQFKGYYTLVRNYVRWIRETIQNET